MATTSMRAQKLSEDLGFLLARAAAEAVTTANKALQDLGLSVRSYSVLALAADTPPPAQSTLSEFLRLDPSQIVALVDDLERRGLARREVDPTDRRVRLVVATQSGANLATEAADLLAAANASGSPDDDLLISLLRARLGLG